MKPLNNNFYQDMQILGDRYSGLYLLNKFLIKISTTSRKSDIPSYDYEKHTFSVEDQLDLQQKNFVTLFHELVHYTHEISTMAGITQFYMEAVSRSIFSGYVNVPDNSTCQSVTGKKKEMLDLITLTSQALRGGAVSELDGQIVYRIGDVLYEEFEAYAPFHTETIKMRVPQIIYEFAHPVSNQRGLTSIYFGKFYLYEGIAHILDQLVSLQRNVPLQIQSKVRPEYKIMQQVAMHLFPEIDLKSMLELASLSLSYWNCGEMFVRMVKEASTVPYLPGFIMEMRNDVINSLTEKRNDFLDSLEEIKSIFSKRAALAAAANHLCNEMAKGYELRIQNPIFEIDCVFAGDPVKMTEFIAPCDMVYELIDEDDYMKDFAGTYLEDHQLSRDLKTFLCHVDYYQSEIQQVKYHSCPLYTFCDYKLRKEKSIQCRRQPRLSYESSSEYGWCNYSLGVAYNKGEDKPMANEHDTH